MKWLIAVGLVLVTAGALVLRLPSLDQRPFHTDESVHAVKFLGLWEAGEYRYDPHEYHGPSLYYATLPSAWLSGAEEPTDLSETTLRLTPVLFGAGVILLLFASWKLLGSVATIWAAVFTAFSPVMVYYSRYFIHEMLLVFFTFAFLICVGRYVRSPGLGWMMGAGVSLGLMHATKETFLFPLAAAIGALAAVALWRRFRCEPRAPCRWRKRDFLWGIASGAAVSTLLFTSFGDNWQGPLDAWRSYGPWLGRAEGESPHVHGWDFYWGLLLYTRRGSGPVWTELMILILGAVGMWGSLISGRGAGFNRDWGRFLTFYTLGLSVLYTVVPYKTPWCVLGFWHGWIVLAGVGGSVLLMRWQQWWWRSAVVVVLLAGTLHLVVQSRRAAFRYADSRVNPYVYAHTSSSLLDLVDKVGAIVQVSPEESDPVILVMVEGGDYWPLPWYFRGYRGRVGWHATLPTESEQVMGDVVVASVKYSQALGQLAGERLVPLGLFGLRDGLPPERFLQLHVEPTLWERYLNRPTGVSNQ